MNKPAAELTEFSFDMLKTMPRGEVQEFRTPHKDRTGTLKLALTDCMGIVDGTMITKRPAGPLTHYNEMRLVEMNFMLEGNILQTHEGLLKEFPYKKGYHNILFNPQSTEINQQENTGTCRIFSVHIAETKMADLLAGYLPELAGYAEMIRQGKPFVLHAPNCGFNAELRYFFDTFWPSSMPGNIGKLYLESRVMELLARQCALLLEPGSKAPAVSKSDLEKVHYARELVLLHLSQPLSLMELSGQVQLNEFKLKKYFREVFGTSVFGMVQEERLQKARRLLYSGEMCISEVAYGLGYAHTQHFQRAFRKRFGVTPGSLKA